MNNKILMPVLAFADAGSFSALKQMSSGICKDLFFDSPPSSCYHVANNQKNDGSVDVERIKEVYANAKGNASILYCTGSRFG